MSETTPLIKAALNLRVGVGFDVYVFTAQAVCSTIAELLPPFRERRGQGRRREQQHTEPENIFGELCQRAAPNQYPALHRR